ncbi:MAG: TauD/TfdA family dioxygenase [Planctomycetaceae bacterium]|nr:TauD/TfdA family dioxygenase [Planctomycetales bacterium]MCB9937373.1 TauD/TfdA family dioxygenase [Planctomycetaceae bacterium]
MPEPLPNVTAVSVAAQQSHGGIPFPLVLACQTPNTTLAATTAWIESHRSELEEQLAVHGALLFRGFPLATPQDFDAFIGGFGYPNFPYKDSLSNAVRTNFTERVFSANEAPADVTIYLHHEMAQTPIYPSKLLFFCEQAAETGGATPLCRSDILYEQLAERCPDFLNACETKGLRYTNVMPSLDDPASGMGRSWQSTFRRETREEAEARMRELGYTWEWLDDGCLRATTPRLQAVREVAPGRKSFFNQLIAAFKGWKDSRNDPSKAMTLGDGTPLDRDAVMLAAELAEALTFDVPWQNGDVALVDNYIVMHARRTFTGKRKILASLVAAEAATVS